jgi:hypothetical protein
MGCFNYNNNNKIIAKYGINYNKNDFYDNKINNKPIIILTTTIKLSSSSPTITS